MRACFTARVEDAKERCRLVPGSTQSHVCSLQGASRMLDFCQLPRAEGCSLNPLGSQGGEYRDVTNSEAVISLAGAYLAMQ